MYLIERASLDDVEKLVEIQISAFSTDFKMCGSGPPGFDSLEHQIKCLDNYFYFVIKGSTETVGGFYFSVDEKSLNLIRLFVEPSKQNQGLGKLVLDFLANQMSKNMSIELETPTFSVEVQRFYENNGFQKVQRIDYKSGSSFLYRKSIEQPHS